MSVFYHAITWCAKIFRNGQKRVGCQCGGVGGARQPRAPRLGGARALQYRLEGAAGGDVAAPDAACMPYGIFIAPKCLLFVYAGSARCRMLSLVVPANSGEVRICFWQWGIL